MKDFISLLLPIIQASVQWWDGTRRLVSHEDISMHILDMYTAQFNNRNTQPHQIS